MLLRWAGVVVLYGASVLAHQLGHYRTSLAAGNVIAPFVIVYNVLVWRFIVAWTRQPPQNWRRAYRLLGNGQCAADLTVLTIGLHFGGGVETQAVAEIAAVLVVAGLVLSAADSLLQGVYACALLDAVIIGEATGHLSHAPLDVLRPGLVTNRAYVTSVVVLLDIVLLFITAIVVFIAQRIRLREAELTRLYGREREAVERLEELDRMKSDFLATVSHELRTPLTAIRGFAMTLVHNWDRSGDAVRKEQIGIIDRQSERLDRLVGNLLDFSRLESGRAVVHPEVVELASLVATAVASSSLDGAVQVSVPAGLEVLADRDRTEQVLVNLLENARKYGEPPIRVEAAWRHNHVVVVVEDQGAGVPADEVPRLFGRFYQVERGPAKVSSGVGLGLALVKGYVEAQGGETWYEEADGGGARFSFTLPTPPAS